MKTCKNQVKKVHKLMIINYKKNEIPYKNTRCYIP